MDKITLPIKTKIAAWWMLIIGTISLVMFLGEVILIFTVDIGPIPYGLESFFVLMCCSFISIFIFFLPGIFLLQQKVWARKFASVMLLIGVIIFLFGGLLITFKLNLLRNVFNFLYYFWPRMFGIPFISALITFILLLSDRKNFKETSS